MGCSAEKGFKVPSPVRCVTEDAQEDHFNQVVEVTSAVPHDPEKDKFHTNYLLGIKLGRGAFAQVRLASRRRSGPELELKKYGELAVKIIKMDDEKDEQGSCTVVKSTLLSTTKCRGTRQLQKNKLEASNWSKLGRHPHCVALHDVCFSNNFFYMVMEKCDRGLFQAMETMGDNTERGFGNVIAQMLLGISHCHSCNVIHRDIKPDNFLVGGDGAAVVKLADFGFSTFVPNGGEALGLYGTAPFMCPEMLRGEQYDKKADVWSLGVVVYTFLFGSFPYTATKEALKSPSASSAMKRAIRVGTTPSFEPHSRTVQMRSDEAMQAAKALLNRDARARPSADEALQMTWLAASLQARHLPDADLPSLRPMLYAARKAGAFEVRDLTTVTSDDELLNQLQQVDQCKPKAEQSDHGTDVDMPVQKVISTLSAGPILSNGVSDSMGTHTTNQMLNAASKAGAFEVHDLTQVPSNDDFLSQLQQANQCKPKADQSDYGVDVDIPSQKAIGALSAGPFLSKVVLDSTDIHTLKKDWETVSQRSTASGGSNARSEPNRWNHSSSSSKQSL